MAGPVILFYPFYISDHARKSSGLSLTEEGSLRRLLDAYYAQRGPFPKDLASVVRHARPENAKERATVIAIIERFFPLGTDGMRHNERADAEIVIALKRMATARENGGKGGRKPSGQPGANPAGSPAGKQPPPQRGTYSHSQSAGDGDGGPFRGPHITEQGIGISIPPARVSDEPPADHEQEARDQIGELLCTRLRRSCRDDPAYVLAVRFIAGANAAGLSWDDIRERVTYLLDTGRGVSFITLLGEHSASSPTESAP